MDDSINEASGAKRVLIGLQATVEVLFVMALMVWPIWLLIILLWAFQADIDGLGR